MRCWDQAPEGSGSGSSSYFGKVLVPVPAPVPIRTYLSQFFNNNKIFTKSCLFDSGSSIVSQKVGLFLLLYYIYVGSELEPECIFVSGSAQAKSCGLGSGFGSTTLPNIAQGIEYYCLYDL
jgi:hypothetical protein